MAARARKSATKRVVVHAREVRTQWFEDEAAQGAGAGDLLQQTAAVQHVPYVLFGGQIVRRDERRLSEVAAADVDAAHTGGPGRLETQIETGKRVHLDAGAGGVAGAVGHRIEIQLHIGPHRRRIGAQETAELIDAQRERPRPRQQVADARTQLSQHGMQFVVQRRPRRLEGIDDGEMVLKIAAHRRIVHPPFDAVTRQQRARADA